MNITDFILPVIETCIYSDTTVAEKHCSMLGCNVPLCGKQGGSCGYIIDGHAYCNECFATIEDMGNDYDDYQTLEEAYYYAH